VSGEGRLQITRLRRCQPNLPDQGPHLLTGLGQMLGGQRPDPLNQIPVPLIRPREPRLVVQEVRATRYRARTAEKTAREVKRGLWADPSPTPVGLSPEHRLAVRFIESEESAESATHVSDIPPSPQCDLLGSSFRSVECCCQYPGARHYRHTS
jgi:hypothetical protein